jgi:hypothetical protein
MALEPEPKAANINRAPSTYMLRGWDNNANIEIICDRPGRIYEGGDGKGPDLNMHGFNEPRQIQTPVSIA